jgi:hypothetical protein
MSKQREDPVGDSLAAISIFLLGIIFGGAMAERRIEKMSNACLGTLDRVERALHEAGR